MPTIPSDYLVKSLTNDLADFFKSKGINNFQGPDDVDWISIDDETSYKNRYNSISINEENESSSETDDNDNNKPKIRSKTIQISTLLPDYQRPTNQAMPDPVSNKNNIHEQKDNQKNSKSSLSDQDLLKLKPILKSVQLTDEKTSIDSSNLLSEIEDKNLQLLKKMLELTNFSPETIENLLEAESSRESIGNSPITTSIPEIELDSFDPTDTGTSALDKFKTILSDNPFSKNIQNHTENAKTLQTASLWLNGSNKLNQWSQKNTVGVILICIAVLAIICIPCLLIQIFSAYIKKKRGLSNDGEADKDGKNKVGNKAKITCIKSRLPISKNVKNVFRNSSVTSTMPLNMSNNSEGSLKCSFPDLRFSIYKQRNKNGENFDENLSGQDEAQSTDKQQIDTTGKLQYRSSIETQHTVSTRVPSLQTTLSKQESLPNSQFNSLNRSIHDHVVVSKTENNNNNNSSQKTLESSQYLETVAGRLKRKVSLDDIRNTNQSIEKSEQAVFYTLPRSGKNKSSNPSSQKQNLKYYNMTKPKPVVNNNGEGQQLSQCVSKNNFQPYPIFVDKKPKSKKTSRKLAYDDSFLSFRPTCYLAHSRSNGEKKISLTNKSSTNNNNNNIGNEPRQLHRNLSRSVNDLDQMENSDLRPSPYRLEINKIYEKPRPTTQKKSSHEKEKVKISKSHNPEGAKNRAEKILISNSKSMKIEKGKIDDGQRLFVGNNKGSSVFIEDYFIHADPVC